MSLMENFSRLSARTKAWWILGLIIVFTVMVGVASGGNIYNSVVNKLAEKTNNIVVLPHATEIPFTLGLDLQGGAHLVYQADVENIPSADRDNALASVRDVIERRVNAFGVSEPIVQVNKTLDGQYRIIAELAGVKDVKEAIKMIGETPTLEFKEQEVAAVEVSATSSVVTSTAIDLNTGWKNTELTGKYLKRASVQFNPNDGSPEVSLEFDSEGAQLFEDITARNVGKPVAIFLDGYPINTPNVNEKITGGQASISGNFNIEEAKLLVTRLNSGALPVPINLISQKTVEASLGAVSINNSLQAALIGLLLVSLFMILYYRLPGLLAVVSLAVYGLTILAIFKTLPLWLALILMIVIIGLIFYIFSEMKVFNGLLALLFIVLGSLLFFFALKPITLSLAGIAGFILSIGMAVDAHILIFARTREEIKAGKSISQAVDEGWRRAWPSIRDGHISTIFTCLILMFFGTSSIQGFGTTLFIGVVISIFSAMVVTHILLIIVLGSWSNRRWLLGASPVVTEKTNN
ncbi:preprotein translocase subunit SecD [Candidatus Falkowbacteria bacterium]|uniref:Protein translocase subunit SecD n=1 Tax=Candidatus Falkowbacteria bacterium CG10_big_fil_rev_8_21_14_0_10_37_18 TaxID=1974562 RepID=A0A2H0VAD3_9BACT|nr:preprotein translocase subunit SecD [Candidatus Falkowbacteria bacterium]NCQ12835.1 preprotein translocase subunit SecD [Candidatus Falkowbacteria bacterium]PIR95329.1 MAG: protein translocase subunit SecD [Candidatus Falkowbacteria bacterium CG10_big_fil_rev_8_21_14_0_10_37_18]